MTKYKNYRNPYNVNVKKFSIYSKFEGKDEDKILSPGDEVVVTINDVDNDGRGIGKFKNHIIYVPKATLGEKVRIRIIKRINNEEYLGHVVKRLGELRL